MVQHQLKQNIVGLVKQKGLSISWLEREAGLHKNFISNFLHNKSKNPGIDSIIKISNVLNVSIDELIGKKNDYQNYNTAITRKDIFFEAVEYLLKTFASKNSGPKKLEDFFNAVCEIYMYSIKKGSLDKEFANWFISCRL